MKYRLSALLEVPGMLKGTQDHEDDHQDEGHSAVRELSEWQFNLKRTASPNPKRHSEHESTV